MKKRGNSDIDIYNVDAQNAKKSFGTSSWPQVGDKVFAKTDMRVKEFQMATVMDFKDSDSLIKVRWDSSLDFSWLEMNPKLLQKVNSQEKRSRMPVNLYSKGTGRPRGGRISYDERDNGDDASVEEMDVEEEMPTENTQQECNQEGSLNVAFKIPRAAELPQSLAALQSKLDAVTDNISVSSSSALGRCDIAVEKDALINKIDTGGSTSAQNVSVLPVTKTEIEELNESISAIEGKMDSDIKTRLRVGLDYHVQLSVAVTSGSGSHSGGDGVSCSNNSNSNNSNISNNNSSNNKKDNDGMVDGTRNRNRGNSSIDQSPDKKFKKTIILHPHLQLLRFHSLNEVPNFRSRWREASENTKVGIFCVEFQFIFKFIYRVCLWWLAD